MTTFSSKLTVLKVNEIDRGTSAKTGKPWERHTAECMLLDSSGNCFKVGKLDIAPSLRGTVNPGTFTASFGLDVPDYGNNQGRVSAFLTALLPADGGLLRPPVGAGAAPVSSKA